MSLNIYNIAGLVGVVLALYAYACVQWRRDFAKTLAYSVLNLLNAALILVSLIGEWNLAVFVSNSIWIGLSLYGVVRCLRYKTRERAELTLPKDHRRTSAPYPSQERS